MTLVVIIPPTKWGRDHWSTLAYIQTVMATHGMFTMKGDARMRSNRTNFMLMPSMNGMSMSEHHGTRLKDGNTVPNHDDWCCLQDFAEEGLLSVSEVEPGCSFRFSEKGMALVTLLLRHKMSGGSFSNFEPNLK